KGRTKYVVTLAGSLGDVHDQTLGTDAKLTFDVGNAEPRLFGPESDMVVLDPAAPKAYTVYSINEPGLHTRVFAVGPEDWAKYATYLEEWERPRKLLPPGRLVIDRVLTPGQGKGATPGAPALRDELVATSIDLSAALSGGLGQVLVIVEPTRPPSKNEQR